MPTHLFIRPPYGSVKNGWEQLRGFDHQHYYLRARSGTAVDPAVVYACFNGTLSVLPPQYLGRDILTPIDVTQVSEETLPARLNLFLHNNGYSALIELRDRVRELARSLGVSSDLPSRWLDEPHVIGAAYANLETVSLLKYLTPQLRQAYITDSGETVSDQDLLLLFAQGRIHLQLSSGLPIAEAAPGQERREVSFMMLTDHGPSEPSSFYKQHQAGIADDALHVSEYLQEFPVAWPLISEILSREDAFELIKTEILPYSALQAFKTSAGLGSSDWRLVGDYQKDLYLRRLLRRSGHAPAEVTDPPFVFNDSDRYALADLIELNLFQLEAVVEFYANHGEPWGAEPPRLLTVIEGTEAIPDAGDARVLTLGSPVAGIQPFLARIFLHEESERASKSFLITVVDGDRVMIDGAAQLTGGRTAWRIIQGRYVEPVPGSAVSPAGSTVLYGEQAQVVASHPRRVVIGDQVNLSGLRPMQHKLVLLEDTARNHRTYLVTAIDTAQRRITVDGEPVLAGLSRWMIDLYMRVDFLPLRGNAPGLPDPANRRVLTLDGLPDLYRVWPNRSLASGAANADYLYDTLWLTRLGEEPRIYRILEVNPDDSTVTLATDADLPGQGWTWEIQERPTLVMIDPFGARKYQGVVLRGGKAESDPANSRVLALDRPPDLSVVSEGIDTLVIGTEQYAITGKEVGQHTVILGRECLQTGVLRWRITRSFLGVSTRVLSGRRAYPDSADRTRVRLSDPPDLRRCNPCFDTIYLYSDEAPGRRPQKTYRIIAVDDNFTANDLPTVEVSEETQLAGGVSAWEIQAGIGGELPSAPDHLVGPGTRGLTEASDYRQLWDHYDGILFYFFKGRLDSTIYCWSTLTSRDRASHLSHADGHLGWLSSIRGNRLYFYRGRLSGNNFINYAFEVVDPAPYRDVYAATDVREARHYFGDPRQYPFANPTQPRRNREVIADPLQPVVAGDTVGKTHVMIHQGNTGGVNNGSAGCLVSYWFRSRAGNFRSRLLALQNGEVPASFGTAYWARTTSEAAWNNKMVGRLWVVRPDELPIGNVHNLPD